MAELALIAHLTAFILFVLNRGRPGRCSVLIGGGALFVLLLVRSIRIAFPALTGTYEGLVFLTAAMDLFIVFGYRKVFREHNPVLAASAFVAFLFLAVIWSPLVPDALYPPVPILRSYWLVVHVAFSFVGLALFTVSLVAAILGFVVENEETVDLIRDRAVILGFVFYATGGLVFGAIWAESAWGRFWGWDPKETWALITSLLYTGYLHLRFVRRISQSTARILVILAWFFAGFTFWGVNYLISGLHSYL